MDSDPESVDVPEGVQHWIDITARVGYAAKGVVYGIVGVLTCNAAWNYGKAAGATEAIKELYGAPFGRILVGIVAVGLLAYSAWRFVQAIMDPDQKGSDWKGLMMRFGIIISGFVYLGMSGTAALLAVGGTSSGGSLTHEWTRWLLTKPFGQIILGGIGAVLFGIGIHHFRRAYTASFMKRFEQRRMNDQETAGARRIGQFGLSARGVTFSIIGFFSMLAAWKGQAGDVKNLAGAFDTLGDQPYGPYLLGVVALGFIAYGVYCVSRAMYRDFDVD